MPRGKKRTYSSCYHCEVSGGCPACHSLGYITIVVGDPPNEEEEEIDCPECNGSGACQHCMGTGKIADDECHPS